MGNAFAPAQTSFNAGELSPLLAGRVDMAKYGNGCFRMRNFLPMPQGPARRRSGTRFVAETKNSAHRSWLAKFIFSEDDSYILEFGDNYIRFYTDNGVLLNLGVPYEIVSPYDIADLTNSDGTFRLDMEQTGDVIFITHPSHPPKKLARLGVTNWTIANADIKNGPFIDVNPDQTATVYASAETGAVTLTASSAIFTAPMVGTLFLLESKKIDSYKVWEPAKTIAINDERRSDSNVYKALNAATTGTVKPTHREGAKFDGDAGVQWDYLHSGYGIARITAIGGGGTTATATVISRIPSQAVGAPNASTRWAPSAWRSDLGFPALCTIFRERLCFARGQQVWGSVAGSFEDFAARDGAETLPDSAFSITLGSSETNAAVWMVPSDALLVGTRGAEFNVSEVTTSEVFGPGNIKAVQESCYGSRQVRPSRIGDSTMFVQPTGRRVRDMRYSFNVNGYDATDLMVLSDHIAHGQIVQEDFALEPHSIMWACCNNGDLIGLTYLLEQDVIGWHPHPVGSDGRVESVRVIPAPGGTHDQIWLQVRRTINGVTKRFVEYFEKDWLADETLLEDALFSDAGATFNGLLPGEVATISGGITWQAGETGAVTLGFTPAVADIGDHLVLKAANGDEAQVQVDSATNPANVTFVATVPVSLRGIASVSLAWARNEIAGLGYLEGEEVTLTVNGAAHPRRTVSAGTITLQSPASVVQVGLPCDAELVTMRIEGGSSTGTAQAKIKRVQQCAFRVHESLGGSVGPENIEQDDIEYRSDADPMDNPPPIFTGDYTMPYPEGYTTDARIRLVCDQPLPFTLVAIYPRMVVEDRI